MFENSDIDPQSPSRDSEQGRGSSHFSSAATTLEEESASATGDAEGEEGKDGRGSGARRGRNRDQHRGFSLSESDLATEDGDAGVDEDDDDDGASVATGSEALGIDDGVDGEDGGGGGEGGGGGGDEGGVARRRGRSAHRRGRSTAAISSSSPPPGPSTGSVEIKRDGSSSSGDGNAGAEGSEAATSHAAESTGPAGGGDAVGVSEGVAGDAMLPSKLTPVPSTSASTTTAAATAASGPGAAAREKGWSDPELLMGLVNPEDVPVVAAHDVSRSVGGVEVKRGLLLVCRNTLYFVDGFGREPALVRTGSGSKGAAPRSAAAAAAALAAATAAASAAARSKDPLHGVRRLEEWELGGGAGGIGAGDDDGEAGGVKIQVTLRRKSATDIVAGAAGERKDGGGGGESAAGLTGGGGREGGTAVTAEQAGGTGCESGAGVEDEILALGKFGVQRIALDQVCGTDMDDGGNGSAFILVFTACGTQRSVVSCFLFDIYMEGVVGVSLFYVERGKRGGAIDATIDPEWFVTTNMFGTSRLNIFVIKNIYNIYYLHCFLPYAAPRDDLPHDCEDDNRDFLSTPSVPHAAGRSPNNLIGGSLELIY